MFPFGFIFSSRKRTLLVSFSYFDLFLSRVSTVMRNILSMQILVLRKGQTLREAI